jgi:hypothetical protein
MEKRHFILGLYTLVGYFVIACLLFAGPIYMYYNYGYSSCEIFHLSVATICLLIMIGSSPRWLAIITLTKDLLIIYRPFHKTIHAHYKDYPFIINASYFHSGPGGTMGTEPAFIVLSKKLLSSYERTNINQLGLSDSILKIPYNKKNYDKLMEMLPTKQAKDLEAKFKDYHRSFIVVKKDL